MKRTFFYPIRLVGERSLFVFLIFLSLFNCCFADWSSPILLWESPDDITTEPGEATIASDLFGNIHIVTPDIFRLPDNPVIPRGGLLYTRFDAWGNVLTPTQLLTDSLDVGAGSPFIHFFGQDSLWIFFSVCHSDTGFPDVECGFEIITMNLAGEVLSPAREWEYGQSGVGGRYVFDVRADGTIVFATMDIHRTQILMTVQSSDGDRLMNEEVVWNQAPCNELYGYIDNSDSLQLVWRQYPSWQAVFGKRVDTNTEFSPANLGDHVELTSPGAPEVHAPVWIEPLGDSLIILLESSPGPIAPYLGLYLRTLMRDGYSELASTYAGAWDHFQKLQIEFDGTIGMLSHDLEDRSLHFRRYSTPLLTQVEDTLLVQLEDPYNRVGQRDYHVAADGSRHLIYCRAVSGQWSQLYYMYWRESLDLGDHTNRNARSLDMEVAVYPNPFNSSISIPLELSKPQIVDIRIYNVLGQEVYSFGRKMLLPGRQELVWEGVTNAGVGLASGVYVVQARTAAEVTSVKVELVR